LESREKFPGKKKPVAQATGFFAWREGWDGYLSFRSVTVPEAGEPWMESR
jgi:hypothetical protein